jgi:hypothetical protein
MNGRSSDPNFGAAVGTTSLAPTADEKLELGEDFRAQDDAPKRISRTAIYDSFS